MKYPLTGTSPQSSKVQYTLDLHIHTKYSKDSIQDPKQVLKVSMKKNLSGVAITDHNTIKGGLITKLLPHENLLVIIGSEVQTDKGEVIGLFLNEEIKSSHFFQVCDEIKDQDGIIILPHPYRNKILEPTKEMLDCVDLIEGLNARTPPELNLKAQALAQRFGLPFIAGSDAHLPMEIGRVQNILPENESNLDEEDLKKKLLNNKICICGAETPFHICLLSKGIGRYKTTGVKGLIKSSVNMVFK